MNFSRNQTVSVLGLPLASLTLDQAVDRIEELILEGGVHQVATANLNSWLESAGDAYLHRVLAACDLVLADGMPLVWASRMLGSVLPARIIAVDIIPRLLALSSAKGYRIFLLGDRADVADRARELFESKFPGVHICGAYAPPAGAMKQMEHNQIVEKVRAAGPDILLVGFEDSRQEKWIAANLERLGVPVAMGVGASLSVVLGDRKRAPRWMRNTGLEWLLRLAQEPGRLAPRYWNDLVGLTSRLPLALAATWAQPRYHGPTTTSRTHNSTFLHLHVAGSVNAALTPVINRAVEDCIGEMKLLCIHMDRVAWVDAEGLGLLLDARRRLLNAGLTLQTAKVPAGLRFRFFAWCVGPLLEELTPRSLPAVTKESVPAMHANKN
jgi:N-acetylglucosaminyldiphosphoundecaprenol N-acetyl-beta-D-mannosaminyltransferase